MPELAKPHFGRFELVRKNTQREVHMSFPHSAIKLIVSLKVRRFSNAVTHSRSANRFHEKRNRQIGAATEAQKAEYHSVAQGRPARARHDHFCGLNHRSAPLDGDSLPVVNSPIPDCETHSMRKEQDRSAQRRKHKRPSTTVLLKAAQQEPAMITFVV